MPQITVQDADEMRDLGAKVAARLLAGDVLVLTGPLGAGKTTFAQGIGRGLGISEAITSPTFVVAREHRSGVQRLSLIHVDAYRLSSSDDLLDLELDSREPHVTIMEWGADFATKITDSWLEVCISRTEEGEQDQPESGPREVTFIGHGDRWSEIKIAEFR